MAPRFGCDCANSAKTIQRDEPRSQEHAGEAARRAFEFHISQKVDG